MTPGNVDIPDRVAEPLHRNCCNLLEKRLLRLRSYERLT